MLRLSDNIAGVTILAFGNGAPDIFTSMVADKDEVVIMFTELIGAGVFVTAVIAGTVAVIAPFQVDLRAFMRDCCFYVLAVCWISMVVRDDTVHLWEAASERQAPLLSLYTKNRRKKKKRTLPRNIGAFIGRLINRCYLSHTNTFFLFFLEFAFTILR